MKRITNILCMAGMGLMLFSACETDRDDNPTLYEPESFVLNTPDDKMYDLGANDTIRLTLTPPEYGFSAATTYSVQVGLQQDFIDETEEADANYSTLSTTYNTASIALRPDQLNSALASQYQTLHPDENPTGATVTAYIRVKAEITGSGRGLSTSNTIAVNQVKLGEVVNALEPPTTMYLIGSSIGAGGWSEWKPMVAVNGMAGEFWSMVYFDANAVFKFGTMVNEYIGYTDSRLTIKDNAGAGVSEAPTDGNIQVSKAGWYILYIQAAVNGDDYAFTMTFYEPNVYVFGATAKDSWGYTDEWKFTVPDTKEGNFESPVLGATGEVRMCIQANTDWWRLEFTLKGGTDIFYRENNAVNNGWTDMGAEYSVTGKSGQKIYLNFASGTGEVK